MAAPFAFSITPHSPDQHLRLDQWRRNVGAPVVLDLAVPDAPAAAALPTELVVLSWNVWIGQGRLTEVLSRIRNGDYVRLGANPEAPLVVLLQEAYRSDSSVPPLTGARARRRLLGQLGPQEDVVQTAREFRLNLRYAPSMRNGSLPSDRGNAILSTLPLLDAHALELPLVLQRRVVVSAGIRVGGLGIRLVSAHLDPRGPPGNRWLGVAGRAEQAAYLLAAVPEDSVILGADLNLGRGRYEPTWRLLDQAGFSPGIPPSLPTWRHTFHALPRLVLDYILVRDRCRIMRRARVQRLDEHPFDRGSRVFGSDHHPLIAQIELHPEAIRE